MGGGYIMKMKINNKIDQLSLEAQALISRREEIYAEMNSIEVRLHQIAGAIGELHSLITEEPNEVETINKS